MGPFLTYTALRLGLLVAAVAVLYAFGARGWLLLVLAAVASMALSFVLLGRARDEVARAVQRRADRPAPRRDGRPARGLAGDEAAEDAEASGEERREEG
ncbi:MAG: DUF4229 domain-containing protein [Actinomycetes bacterium]